MHSFAKKGLTATAVAALLLVGATQAQADPAFAPDADDIVGVGSDTTQYALNDLAAAYNAGGADARLASWDAFGSATITPRAGAAEIARPNGSSAGIRELRRDGTAVDFARSSRARQAGDDTGANPVLFLPFATDDLNYAAARDTNAVLDLTAAELADVYTCDVTNWSAFGGASATINPLLPQSGSGTRSFFLESIGVSEANLGTCVDDTVQEHDATPIAADPNAIAPFSLGRFNTQVPVENGEKIIQLNTAGYEVSRTLYNVVRDVNGVPAHLVPVFGDGADDAGWICSDAATDVIAAAGFTQITFDDGCGLAE